MAAPTGRVVAELGRPETPDETAERKAESSRVYRSSQTFRNLVAALIITVAVVLVVYFAVPRASFPDQPSVDVTAAAAQVSADQGRAVLTPATPADWRVNSAAVATTDGGAPAWTIVYAPPGSGYLRMGQAFDESDAWARTVLQGSAATGTTTIDGVTWQVYDLAGRPQTGNITYALGTQAGPDQVLLYGTLGAEQTARVAASLSAQLRSLATTASPAPTTQEGTAP